jgi:4-amino-4-deoxy-L-arabinose transferase-like glycosyltransferase
MPAAVGPRGHARTRWAAALGAIIALGLALMLCGLGTGLPNPVRAYSMYPDEWTPLRALQSMDPQHLDFNPHYFDNPTLFYYMIGGGVFIAHLGGFVRLDGDERFYFEHPEQIGRMIVIGRLLAAAFGALGIWLVYRVARRFGLDRGGSTLAALLLAIYPAFVVHGHFMSVNTAVTFWILLAILLMDRWIRRGGVRAAALAGAAGGLALSTKYSAVLLLPLGLLAAWLRHRGATRGARASVGPPGASAARSTLECAAAIAAGAVLFIAGSPYLLLAARESQARAGKLFGSVHAAAGAGAAGPLTVLMHALAWCGSVHLAAVGPATLIASGVGVVLAARRPTPLRVLILAFIGAFSLVALRMGHLATDSRFMPMFPPLAILAATTVVTLSRRHRRAGLLAGAIIVASQLVWSLALVARFIGPQPQEQASEWARTHLLGDERILLAGTANYWSPDLPMREYNQAANQGNYARQTRWRFVAADSFGMPYARARALEPDVVFLSAWLPLYRAGLEWLDDPDYTVVEHYPGRIRLFGRQVHVPLDIYDIDVWVLRRRAADAPAARRM